MNIFLQKTYEKNELRFALFWIIVYCAVNSLANVLSNAAGINSAFNFAFNLILSLILLGWIKYAGVWQTYGICKTSIPARNFLWYLPLILLCSHNLWHGAVMNLPVLDTAFYVCNMSCVGLLEEVIFRGFLFKALAKDNAKTAILISSITFGLGHLINLVNGSGMGLLDNLCQVFGAIAIGYLFVILFHRGKSLWPCIIAHGVINIFSAFANGAAMSARERIFFSLITAAISLAYAFILNKTLPPARD